MSLLTPPQNSNQLASPHNDVQGWLLDVPGYRENYKSERQQLVNLVDMSEHDETPREKNTTTTRPMSIISTSSEDSVSLEDLINANFTSSMDDETDLFSCDFLDLLDDSKEDFWKLNNASPASSALTSTDSLSLSIIPITPGNSDSNRSIYQQENIENMNFSFDQEKIKIAEHEFLNTLDLTTAAFERYTIQDSPALRIPTTNYQTTSTTRVDRSGSFSSENSLNSASTSGQRRLTTSTSTASSASSSATTGSSLLPRSFTSNSMLHSSIPTSPTRPRQQKLSASDNTTATVAKSGLARRATHIPAPSSSKTSIIPQHTKSTLLSKKTSSSSLGYQQPVNSSFASRSSHIPAPPKRSTTSLGISSIFNKPPTQQKRKESNSTTTAHRSPTTSRPSTSLARSTTSINMSIAENNGSPTRVKRTTSTAIPNSSKSTGLRIPRSNHSIYMK